MKQKLLITAIATIILSSPTNATAGGGGGVTGGATEVTQLANNSELVAIYDSSVGQITNQLTQIANQLNMYNDMLLQATAMPTSYLRDVVSEYTALKKAVQQTVGLYESYGEMATSLQKMWDKELSGDALENALTRAEQAQATLKSISKKIDQTVSQIDQDNEAIETILNRSENAVGRMQAIQVGTEMVAETAQILNKLRDDVATLSAQLLDKETERQLAIQAGNIADEERIAAIEEGVDELSFTTIFDR